MSAVPPFWQLALLSRAAARAGGLPRSDCCRTYRLANVRPSEDCSRSGVRLSELLHPVAASAATTVTATSRGSRRAAAARLPVPAVMTPLRSSGGGR